MQLDLGTGALRILKQATGVDNETELKRYFTAVKPISFPTKGRKKAIFLYLDPGPHDDNPRAIYLNEYNFQRQ